MRKEELSTKKKTHLRPFQIKKNTKKEVGHIITHMKKKELELTILFVGIIFIVLLFSSYFIFSSVQKVEKHNTLKAGKLLIHYKETDTGMGDVVTLNSKKAVSDVLGIDKEPYIIMLENPTKNTIRYKIYLEEDTDMIEIDHCSENLIPKQNIRYQFKEDKIYNLSSCQKKKCLLKTGTIRASSKQQQELRIWVGEQEDIAEEQHYHGKIVIKTK